MASTSDTTSKRAVIEVLTNPDGSDRRHFFIGWEADDQPHARVDAAGYRWQRFGPAALQDHHRRLVERGYTVEVRYAEGVTPNYQLPGATDSAPDWGTLLQQLPGGHLQADRWDITLGTNPAGRPGRAGWVYVAELGDDDVYWPVGNVSAEVRRGDLGGLMRDAYDATREAVTPAG